MPIVKKRVKTLDEQTEYESRRQVLCDAICLMCLIIDFVFVF